MLYYLASFCRGDRHWWTDGRRAQSIEARYLCFDVDCWYPTTEVVRYAPITKLDCQHCTWFVYRSLTHCTSAVVCVSIPMASDWTSQVSFIMGWLWAELGLNMGSLDGHVFSHALLRHGVTVIPRKPAAVAIQINGSEVSGFENSR